MANRKGLGVSRKFYNGSIHENGTGRFVILNRFLGEDGLPWLEFQWLSGDRQADSNKEVNMSASIHKFMVNRKAAGIEPVPQPTREEHNVSVIEMVTEIYKQLKSNSDRFVGLEEMMHKSAVYFGRTNELLENILAKNLEVQPRYDELQGTIDEMHEDNRKAIAYFTEMNSRIEQMMTRTDMLTKQQQTIDKLLDKLN